MGSEVGFDVGGGGGRGSGGGGGGGGGGGWWSVLCMSKSLRERKN